MKKIYQKVTKKTIKNILLRYYVFGELKVGDKIYVGFTINFANTNGKLPIEIDVNNLSLSLTTFVEHNGMLYQLFKNNVMDIGHE